MLSSLILLKALQIRQWIRPLKPFLRCKNLWLATKWRICKRMNKIKWHWKLMEQAWYQRMRFSLKELIILYTQLLIIWNQKFKAWRKLKLIKQWPQIQIELWYQLATRRSFPLQINRWNQLQIKLCKNFKTNQLSNLVTKQ